MLGEGAAPVDAYPEGASPLGFLNLCGNVWEYTEGVMADGHRDGDGKWETDHRFIVLRGGSWHSGGHYWHVQSGAVPNQAHLKVHLLAGAMNRFETVGFRCVKEVR